MCFIFSLFDLVLASEFDLWAFPESSIFEVGGWIADLSNFSFTVFILVGLLESSENDFGGVLGIFVVDSLGYISAVQFPQLLLELEPVARLQ